jgi:hypothetical protein
MSQYDFGTIDPFVRDGAWLADALNQWRDALYSLHGGSAAPAYVTGGVLWRDTAAGAAKTTYKVREGAADCLLWDIDSTGEVTWLGKLAGGNTIEGGLTVQHTVSPAAVIERTNHTANATIQFKTTGSSVYAGHGAAGTFAVRDTADLATTPWLAVTASGASIAGDLSVGGALSVAGAVSFTGTGSFAALTLTATSPNVLFIETDAAADNQRWRWMATGGLLYLQTLDDAMSTAGTAMRVSRSSNTVTQVALAAEGFYRFWADSAGVTIAGVMNLTTTSTPVASFTRTAAGTAALKIEGASGIIYFGQGDAGTFAVSNTSSLVASANPWLMVAAAGATINGTGASPLTIQRSAGTNTNTAIRWQGATNSWYAGFASDGTFAVKYNSAALETSPNFVLTGAGNVFFPTVTTTASTANAYLDTSTAPGNRLLRSTSSARFKRDIGPVPPDELQRILAVLRPRRFRSAAPADDPRPWRFGLIAEDVAADVPELAVFGWHDEQRDGRGRPRPGEAPTPQGVDHAGIGMLVLAAVQDLAVRLAALENRPEVHR